MSIGDNIKRLRNEKGLTQKQLGDLCGMADSAIRRYENGGSNPKFGTVQKIAAALQVSVSELYPAEINAREIEIKEHQKEQLLEVLRIICGKDEIEDDRIVIRTESSQEDLLAAYSKLNFPGRYEALKRVKELTEIPKYRKDSSEE